MREVSIFRQKPMIDRRMVVTGMGTALASAVTGLTPRMTLSQERPPLVPGLPEGVYDTAILDTLPGKKPLTPAGRRGTDQRCRRFACIGNI